MNKKTKSKILKNLLLIFSMTVLCVLFAVSASAEVSEYGNLTLRYDYPTRTLTIEGEGEIEGYCNYKDGEDNALDSDRLYFYDFDEPRIWERFYIDGYYMGVEAKTVVIGEGITSIGSGTFYDNDEIENIVLPNTLKSIGACAFLGCNNLEKINIPSSVEYIGKGTFEDCSSLKEINVDPNNMNYCYDEYGVLYNKDKTVLIKCFDTNITEYQMPDSVKIIDESAFALCHFLKKITLSNQLEEIKQLAFCDCISLQDVAFPETLKKIRCGAFGGCISFKNVVLPKGLEYIGPGAFLDTISLNSITVNGLNTELNNSPLMSLCAIDLKLKNDADLESFIEKLLELYTLLDTKTASEINEMYEAIFEEYTTPCDDIEFIGTIRCHPGSTTEAYAIENEINYEAFHTFGDWIYDWDNLVRSRECEICGLVESEPLEKTENGGVEIIEPVDPETEFIVEEISKNGDKYAVVEKSLNENLEGIYSVLKTFDITLKNNDGVHVQPNGTVKVKLPLDWDKDGDYKVYRINDDGTLTDMNAVREGSHMVFETDHFSIYVIVDESAEEAPEENRSEENSPLNIFAKLINLFKQLILKIVSFFQSIGDFT